MTPTNLRELVERLERENAELTLAARWLSEVAGGCEEVTCADPQGENCHCFNRLVGMVRSAGEHLRRRALIGEGK